jgi:hypothetical protein
MIRDLSSRIAIKAVKEPLNALITGFALDKQSLKFRFVESD